MEHSLPSDSFLRTYFSFILQRICGSRDIYLTSVCSKQFFSLSPLFTLHYPRGSPASDIFAVGITLMEIMLKDNPYFKHVVGPRPRFEILNGQRVPVVDLESLKHPFHIPWTSNHADQFYSEKLRSLIDSMVVYV